METARTFMARPWRRMMLVLTLMVVLAGHMVPQGVMPVMAGDGVLRMSICADSALATPDMVLTEAGHLIPADAVDFEGDAVKAGAFCPFAAASLALPVDTGPRVADVAKAGITPGAPRMPKRTSGAASPLPPATGPPAIA